LHCESGKNFCLTKAVSQIFASCISKCQNEQRAKLGETETQLLAMTPHNNAAWKIQGAAIARGIEQSTPTSKWKCKRKFKYKPETFARFSRKQLGYLGYHQGWAIISMGARN